MSEKEYSIIRMTQTIFGIFLIVFFVVFMGSGAALADEAEATEDPELEEKYIKQGSYYWRTGIIGCIILAIPIGLLEIVVRVDKNV